MMARVSWIAVAAGLAMAVGLAQSAGAEAKYVGVAKCKSCHKKELIGDQYGAWEKSSHRSAMESLKTDQAKKIATDMGISGAPSEAAECTRCHSTAAAVKAPQLAAKPLKVEDGVQCESCHGPGSDYRKKKVMSDHAASVAAGMLEAGKSEATCTACHNAESPTFDAAAGFNFEERKKKIAHPIPAEVKGRYIEAEKAARDAKKK